MPFLSILEILQEAVKRRASDVHLITSSPPALRIDGEIILLDSPPLNPEECEVFIKEMATEEQMEVFREKKHLGFSLQVPSVGRFRIELYYEKTFMEAAIRVGGLQPKSLSELGLPPIVSELARKPHGLVLVTGPTGVGKTTTLNSVLDVINREKRCKIVTIEDPIEFMHSHKKSLVVQQEINSDTFSFSQSLVHVLRQDPDIIVIGEMRDLETIGTALTAAETGHLVLATLHTSDATQTIDRIIDVFPPHQQSQIRVQLAATIQGVICQQLLPRVDKLGRVMACEILVATQAIKNLIRENKTPQIYTQLQTGGTYGMQTMDESLRSLYQKGIITYDSAASRMRDLKSLEKF